MIVNYAFRVRVSVGEHGTWGNGAVDDLIRRVPKLRPIVEALQEMPESMPWSALFSTDTVYDEGLKSKVSLEFHHRTESFKVPVLELDLNALPGLADLYKHIAISVRRR